MARSDEVPDEHKDPHHTVPLDVWNKIREDADKFADEEGN